ncbi:hypothetical protein TBLA_0E03860 [Henningerozyma blattae CBS 6284]|uniref:Actin-related protein 5 n=1 Tax=Henningerozyma blattae (strain ATCC 34711 / CBS 6284 / DSM 70876 / NBRC 10599 / NRRL Y-10934 / UCD 77-7) TaxID=1071380 RepID=I2H4Y8_HENB6|nr:hypothetical protein TBLA_0E03860 [Tetrapisispora blattae CBS 6284]CCH61440.1 hypothetical protein TBLA_0E03860 [Tetrapisispora blattae CBS 6284]
MSRDSSLSPLPINIINDPPFNEKPEPFDDPSNYGPDIPIAIDFGSYNVKAGYTNQSLPTHVFTNKLTRYRDRKLAKTMTFIGNDTNLDQPLRIQAKRPYDGLFIANWEYAEEIFDYTLHHLGVQTTNGSISNPIILTEKMACLQSQRANWYQLLFETFDVPSATFGLDSLYAFYNNCANPFESDGLVINCGHEDTNIVPIVQGKGILTEAKRINWGGRHSTEYLSSLLTLKYPYFPTKLSEFQYQTMYEDFCYVSPNYNEDIKNFLTLENLETKDIVVEAPFTEVLQPQKTEEELKIQAEKRKESGRRLQEQAKQKRIEKLVQKEEEFQYYTQLKEQFADQPKRAFLSALQNAGFDDEQDFKKYMYNLERSLAKSKDIDFGDGDEDDDENNENYDNTANDKYNLVDIPDDQLSPEQIREKRKQRLLKANHEARKKAKEEKEKQRLEEEELKRKDQEWRETDLTGWIKDKRSILNELIKKRKDKIKIRDEMKDRKSQTFQNRMKNLATLAEDNVKSGSKRTRQQATIDNDPNDTFGANDEDWAVYNDIAMNEDAFEEALEEEYNEIVALERRLLEFDPNFTEEDTLDAQYDWRNSVLHLFLRGPRPHDSEDPHQQHQIHMNVERIRVPEVMFQPSIGGCDQAGISELSETLFLRKFNSSPRKLSSISERMLNNVWLTGGHAKLPGLKERIVKEYTEFLPVGTKMSINISNDPSLDTWKGMAKLASNTDYLKKIQVTKKDYEEYGPEYMMEHNLGNMPYFQ